MWLNWHIFASVNLSGDNDHFALHGAINNNVPLSWKTRLLLLKMNRADVRECTYRKHVSVRPCRSASVSGLYLKKHAGCAASCETFFKCCAALLHCCHSVCMMMLMQRHWNNPAWPPPQYQPRLAPATRLPVFQRKSLYKRDGKYCAVSQTQINLSRVRAAFAWPPSATKNVVNGDHESGRTLWLVGGDKQ